MPFMTLVGKADALVKVGRVSEAEELVTTTLAEAAKEGALGYQGLTLRLASIAIARKQTAQALEAMSRAAEFARAAGGNRILAASRSSVPGFYVLRIGRPGGIRVARRHHGVPQHG